MGYVDFDRQRFLSICGSARTETHSRSGIGTYQEKSLHWILKQYFSDSTSEQEFPVSGFIADIYSEKGITEIQTSGFSSMRKKLEVFLSSTPVTIVYPIAKNKRVFWMDMESGEISGGHASPKHGSPADVIPELVYILPYVSHPNLTIRTVLLEAEEYRMLRGKANGNRKRRSVRYEQIPVDICAVYDFRDPGDYCDWLPFLPGQEFTAEELFSAMKFRGGSRRKSAYIKALMTVGTLRRIGKQGRAYRYCVNSETCPAEFCGEPERGERL